MRWRLGWLALLFAGVCFAQTDPQGTPQATKPVVDAEFGVGTRQPGLERRVEMYQWAAATNARYQKIWSSDRVESRTFAAGHDNPTEIPLPARRWIATEILLDGKPLDAGVLKALGQWRDYRPDFSALPGNLSATFQPEGDGLGSAVNPLDPQVGDLRITWRELVLPSLKGAVAMNNGMWTLAQPQSISPGTAATSDASDVAYKTEVAAFVGAGLLVLLIVLLAIYMKNRRR